MDNKTRVFINGVDVTRYVISFSLSTEDDTRLYISAPRLMPTTTPNVKVTLEWNPPTVYRGVSAAPIICCSASFNEGLPVEFYVYEVSMNVDDTCTLSCAPYVPIPDGLVNYHGMPVLFRPYMES